MVKHILRAAIGGQQFEQTDGRSVFPFFLRSVGGLLEFVARILGGSLKLCSSGLAISLTNLIVQTLQLHKQNMSTSLRVCSSTICSKFNVQIWVSHSQFEHYFYSNLYERAQKGPRKLEYLTIKFSSSEKATKSCAIVLMVLMFTRHYLVIFFSFLYIQMWFHAQLAQKSLERFSLSSG